ncbi:MAG TPA: ATP synthase F0 subunit B [Terriglobales bacterium]|nr:ATP synthase F0 subunit B [Terriglobales bacterium]
MTRTLAQAILSLFFLSLIAIVSPRAFAHTQEHSSEPAQAASQDHSPGHELARETREETGEEEEHADLKHSSVIRKVASATGLSVHQVHLIAVGFNFALVVFLVYWFARKSLPAAMRNRSEAIQRALQEARAASEEASHRLSEIEARLQKLDSEVSEMQAVAAREAESEEDRIKAAAEEDIRKVVEAAEQEIAAAAKVARRELREHTADLAVALARNQIQVDASTDQTLVRTFAGKLASDGGKESA